MVNDLNVKTNDRISVLLAFVVFVTLPAGWMWPSWLAVGALASYSSLSSTPGSSVSSVVSVALSSRQASSIVLGVFAHLRARFSTWPPPPSFRRKAPKA